MKPPPPLRFLAAAVGSWICVRVVLMAPGWTPAEAVRVGAREALAADVRSGQARPRPPVRTALSPPQTAPAPAGALLVRRTAPVPLAAAGSPPETQARLAALLPPPPPAGQSVPQPPEPMRALRRDGGGRWSGSAWLFARTGGGSTLATGGAIGGSQAGARLLYRLDRNLAVSGRLYTPLRHWRGAEAALGIEWQPVRSIPVRLLAERRQALGETGRSAFALIAHGGVSGRPLAAGLLVDAYAQAGVVGLRRRDLFADGALTVALPVDRGVAIGGGLWGAAQPGAKRLDIGPSVTLRLPVADRTLRLSADWRFRAAGEAAPGSGPSLTLATDF